MKLYKGFLFFSIVSNTFHVQCLSYIVKLYYIENHIRNTGGPFDTTICLIIQAQNFTFYKLKS